MYRFAAESNFGKDSLTSAMFYIAQQMPNSSGECVSQGAPKETSVASLPLTDARSAATAGVG